MTPPERQLRSRRMAMRSALVTANSPFVVRVKMRGKTLAAAMSEIRSWLDNHKIQPAGFTSEPGPDGVGFDLQFC